MNFTEVLEYITCRSSRSGRVVGKVNCYVTHKDLIDGDRFSYLMCDSAGELYWMIHERDCYYKEEFNNAEMMLSDEWIKYSNKSNGEF